MKKLVWNSRPASDEEPEIREADAIVEQSMKGYEIKEVDSQNTFLHGEPCKLFQVLNHGQPMCDPFGTKKKAEKYIEAQKELANSWA